jgi:hypothetical protein
LLDNLAGAKIIGMDLVEVSPPHDHADLTSMFAAHALFAGLGLLAVAEAGALREKSEEPNQGDAVWSVNT